MNMITYIILIVLVVMLLIFIITLGFIALILEAIHEYEKEQKSINHEEDKSKNR